MSTHLRRILVTGGCGFIGSNFIHYLLREHPECHVINLDKLTYAGNPDNVRSLEGDPRYRFVRGDICDVALVGELVEGVDAIVNFAAETHVDRSLIDAGSFIATDILGTYVILEAARRHPHLKRILQVSTDEVYGEMAEGCSAKEEDPLHPRSPYSASKAGADMQCLAFWQSYATPVIVTRCANNLGARQHLEKMVPLFITNALIDEPLPLYGDGQQVRDWLFVEDHCRALDLVLRRGQPGQIYNIGADNYRHNIEVAEAILAIVAKPKTLIRFVDDRKGHDRRYSVDWSKLRSLGWSPEHDFRTALEKTVAWYTNNRWWWERVRCGQFRDYYRRQYSWRLARAKQYQPRHVSV